ncbi:MAG: PIG-L family deacetylase [Candidatus Omnitrophota bacterium]
MLKKRIWIFILAVFSLSALLFIRQGLKQAGNDEGGSIEKKSRILILAPHPDDEAIACAGVIQQALAGGAEVKIAYLTNGDHNQVSFIVYEKRFTLRRSEFIHMGEVRMNEAKKAMKLLGLDESNLIFLGYPDFGTFTMLRNYWNSARAYKSLLTRISSVPYKTDFSFGSPYTGNNILRDLKNVILNYQPDEIFVSHPADVNVDHKSLYIYLQVALADLRNQIKLPKVYPYLVHCAGWPLPRHYHPELDLEPPQRFSDGQINWFKVYLTDEQLKNKHRSILSYRSQTESAAFYLLSFARKNELFGDYTPVDLTQGKDTHPISYSLDNGDLLISIDKTKEIVKNISTLSYFFGYSYEKPFAEMPKIMIVTKYNRVKVFNGPRRISPSEIKVDLLKEILVLRVPLKLLGEPAFLFTSVKVYGSRSLAYFSGFRKIIIKGGSDGRAKISENK